jgi:hypothetical protein
VKPRLRGKATLVRYADDFVIGFEYNDDAKRVMDALGKRLGYFELALHPDKTHLLPFRRPPKRQEGGKGPATFDFLGFTFYWARSRKGRLGMVCKTRSASLRRIIGPVYDGLSSPPAPLGQGTARSAHETHPGALQLLRRERQLQKSAAGDRAGEAHRVQVALPSEPAQASHVGTVRGPTPRLPAPQASDRGSIWGP